MRARISFHVHDAGRLPFRAALDLQRSLHQAVVAGSAPDTLILVEHDPVVTLGRRGDRAGILSPAALAAAGIEIVPTQRGGNVTYHGPGQLVAYPIVNLRRLDADLLGYVTGLEGAVLRVLSAYGIRAQRDGARHGVFTDKGKIASVGVHVSRWVTMHGLALNVDPDMAHWRLIAPCGDADVPATSIAMHLGRAPSPAEVRERFLDAFAAEFEIALRTSAPAVAAPAR